VQVAIVSLLLESEFVMGVGVAVLLTKAAPIGPESEYGILIACNRKITTQYLVNQWIVVGELVASYFY
jgi:hypothetical protein